MTLKAMRGGIMASRKDQSWLEVTVKVSHEMEGAVSAGLSKSVPSLMWQNERKQSSLSLLKAAVVMDGQVDRIISEIEEALRRIEAKHLLLEPLRADLRLFGADERCRDWQEQFRPVQISPRLAVGPPCQLVRADEGQRVLHIDSQEASGAGSHPSTRLALRLLDELLSERYGRLSVVQGWVLDAGCGSGVLALAAAALGDFKVLAVDIDSRAIDAAQGNLRLNPDTGSKVFLVLADLSCARGPFWLVLANLVPSLHIKAYKTLWPAVAPGGWLILSGFCQTHKNLILRPYVQNGAMEKAYSVDHAWAGILLHKLETEHHCG